jgi:hypothetical protein
VCGFSENHRFDEHEAFMAQRGIGWAATYQRKFLILGEDQVLTTDKTPANFHPPPFDIFDQLTDLNLIVLIGRTYPAIDFRVHGSMLRPLVCSTVNNFMLQSD